MTPKQAEEKAAQAVKLMQEAVKALVRAEQHIDDHLGSETLSCLTQASNAIDEVMGVIDELMRPEPTREEMEP